jgi:parallel beta-helix repeat protein
MITNCTITGNSAYVGGGISYYISYPAISHCTIADNSSDGYGGGGIFCLTYDPGGVPGLISNCTIKGNSAEGNGGGVFCDYKTDIIFSNCTISGNSAGSGGGICCSDLLINAMLQNCTITGNSAAIGGGICCNGDSVHYTINNCILWDDTAGAGNEIAMYGGNPKSGYYYHTAQYSVIQGGLDGVYTDKPSFSSWTWGPGNIDEDPCFVDPGFLDVNGVWIDGDYHLLPSSLCINAGDTNYIPEPNETDLDGDLRVIDGRVDMGADEFYNGCFPSVHPDYSEWVNVGMPDCWCYPRQCHGDAFGYMGGSSKTGYYYVGPTDLSGGLAANWLVKEPPFGPGIASGICGDFAHDLGGSPKTGYYRVGPTDLNILIANWLVLEPPFGPGVPPDCLDVP